MSDNDVNEWIAKWRLDMTRQERMQRWLLVGLVVFTALALAVFLATLPL